MAWALTHSLDRFAASAGHFLRADPVGNSVPLTICAALRRRGLDTYGRQPPVFGWWRGPDGAVAAAFLRTPPYPPLLTAGEPGAFRELAGQWTASLDGVRGERAAAREFAQAWQERHGGAVRAGRDTRLYRLAALTPRDPAPPGAPRVAGPADRALIVRWQEAFGRDAGTETPGGANIVDDALDRGGRVLWELPGGEPVAVAGSTPPADGAVRVVAVYTPKEHRGRGYAGAVTAAVSRAALDAGATDVVLFTDLANPVSNGLYRSLGYRPVRDFTEVGFTGGGQP